MKIGVYMYILYKDREGFREIGSLTELSLYYVSS